MLMVLSGLAKRSFTLVLYPLRHGTEPISECLGRKAGCLIGADDVCGGESGDGHQGSLKRKKPQREPGLESLRPEISDLS